MRALLGGLLVLLGAAGLYFGVQGWTQQREVMDTPVLDVTVSERENSPLIAAVGGIALTLGLVLIATGRRRSK